MEQSEKINEIATALSKFQKNIKTIKKDKKANLGFQYEYADINAVLQACKEPLANNSLSISQPMGIIDGKAVLYTQVSHSSGQWIRGCCFIQPDTGGKLRGVQATGSAITYMKRYSLCALLGLDSGDDDDGKAAVESVEKKKAQPNIIKQTGPKISYQKAHDIEKIIDGFEEKIQDNFWRWIKHKDSSIETIRDIPESLYEQVNSALLSMQKLIKEEASNPTLKDQPTQEVKYG